MDYHLGFRFGVSCAIIRADPDLSQKSLDFQHGFKAGYAVAEQCMELRVCSKVAMKQFTLPKNRKKRFEHKPTFNY